MFESIGRCSCCGGQVVVPKLWMGIYPPVPHCTQCGATAKPKGPVVQMDPKPRQGRQ